MNSLTTKPESLYWILFQCITQCFGAFQSNPVFCLHKNNHKNNSPTFIVVVLLSNHAKKDNRVLYEPSTSHPMLSHHRFQSCCLFPFFKFESPQFSVFCNNLSTVQPFMSRTHTVVFIFSDSATAFAPSSVRSLSVKCKNHQFIIFHYASLQLHKWKFKSVVFVLSASQSTFAPSSPIPVSVAHNLSSNVYP